MPDQGRGTTSLDDLLNRCRAVDLPIEVQFKGGVTALEATPIAQLRPLPFRWRVVSEVNADDDEWISGIRFRQTILSKRRSESTSAPTGPNDDLKNWYDKAWSLHEMIGIAERQGSKVLVGFEGGRSALRRVNVSGLRAREYFKWDWVDRPTGVKDMSNWIPGDEFLQILRDAGSLAD